MNTPQLIVMLTHHDQTVETAYEIFEQCKDTRAGFWGFKDKSLPLEEMKRLYRRMKECGKTTVLEVVEYDEAACIRGAQMAVECGCDILMGTVYSDAVNDICKANHIKYMPFVGEVSERPSVLNGSAEAMIAQAQALLKKGVYGFDLLGYRYTGDCAALNQQFVAQAGAPVCIAGSINSYQRLDEIKAAAPQTFTIGGAFFENKFGDSFSEQINKVCAYMDR